MSIKGCQRLHYLHQAPKHSLQAAICCSHSDLDWHALLSVLELRYINDAAGSARDAVYDAASPAYELANGCHLQEVRWMIFRCTSKCTDGLQWLV